jgi:hypothetical protein
MLDGHDGPLILSSYDGGRNNADPLTIERLERDKAWADLSCVILTPASDQCSTRCVASWMGMMKPPNNKTTHLWSIKGEVGEVYSKMVEGILAHPDLGKWKYILTLEHDQSVPPDGLVRLLRRMEDHPEYSAIGGLYFTKGYGGQPQIWGSPAVPTIDFRPQLPDPAGGLVECQGTGMGFTAFRIEMFRDSRLRRPWFKTPANREEGVWTQDLYFWSDARKFGYRCAVDCSVKVGHYDAETDIMW